MNSSNSDFKDLKNNDEEREFQLAVLDYQMCQNGYNSRDQITEDEFSKLVQVFSVFLTVIVALNVFIKVSTVLHIILCFSIGLSGLLSMVAFLIDLESASSCKIALRKRCEDIELMYKHHNALKYWDSISNRNKYDEEKFLKKLLAGLKKRGVMKSDIEGDLYINASRALILLWITIVISIAIWGNSIAANIK